MSGPGGGAWETGETVEFSCNIEDERSPAVATDPAAGRHLVVYEDWRDPGCRGVDIFGRRVAG
jgi:hypothetical protein